MVPTSQTRSVLRPGAILPGTDSNKQLLLHYYETYLQLDKKLLNNLQRKAAKIKQTKNKGTNR